ncbi:MAG: glycoside hydrolase family 1 protein, partial [Pseudomonadota bacterium]|nr:glycoside hydrolase family 1 protein [Pseudomonadota bacterium]
ANVLRLRNVGIPTVGFTWYSLTDQIDWDSALREQNGNVNPLGLFDLDRNIRNVGKAYKQLIADWREVLPASSVCLVVPIVPPSQAGGLHAREQEQEAAARNKNEEKQAASAPELGP